MEFYQSDNRLMTDAIDRLLMEICLNQQDFGKKTVLLTGSGSANGTTTIAINLAISLALSGWRTLFVDADLKKGSKYKRYGQKAVRGLSDFLEKGGDIAGITYNTNYKQLYYIPCGASPLSAIQLLHSDHLGGFMEQVRKDYDFVIFDTPSITVVPDAAALFPLVDGIALVVSLNATTRKQLSAAKREVVKYNDRYYGLIINCVDHGQYERLFPQYNYFDEKRTKQRYKRWMKKEKSLPK